MDTSYRTNKNWFFSIIILLFPFIVMMIREGTFGNTSYHVVLGDLAFFTLIFYCMWAFFVQIGRSMKRECENQGDEAALSNAILERIAFFTFYVLLILSTLTLLFIVSIRLSDQHILDVKMGSVETGTRGRASVYETRIKESPNAPYLIGYELDVETRQASQIRDNPNVQVAVRKNAVGFSVEMLP